MARSFQTLQVQYWDGALKLTPNEKLVELFLMLNRNCECSGVQQIHPDTIREYTGMKQAEVDKALDGLVKKNRIGRCHGNWIIVLGKWEHQQRKTGQAEKALQNSLETSPTNLQVLLTNYLENHSKVQEINKNGTSEVQDGSSCLGSSEKGVENIQKGVDSNKLEPSSRASEYTRELFPDMKKPQLEAGAIILDEIERLDGKLLDDLMPAFRWAREDVVDDNPRWNGWARNFLSCAGLRNRKGGKADRMKWEKILAGYEANHEEDEWRDRNFT